MKFKDLYPVLNPSCYAIIRDNFSYNTIAEGMVSDDNIKNSILERKEVSRINPMSTKDSEYTYEIFLSNACTPLAKTIQRVLLDKLDEYSEAKEKPLVRISMFYGNANRIYDGKFRTISENLGILNDEESDLHKVVRGYGDQTSYIYSLDEDTFHDAKNDEIRKKYSMIIFL